MTMALTRRSGSRRKFASPAKYASWTMAGLAVALLALGAAAAPALADNDRHRGGHNGRHYGPPGHAKHHKHHNHYYQGYRYSYVAPVYAYAPPPVVYVPAPVYRPSPSFTVVIPLDF